MSCLVASTFASVLGSLMVPTMNSFPVKEMIMAWTKDAAPPPPSTRPLPKITCALYSETSLVSSNNVLSVADDVVLSNNILFILVHGIRVEFAATGTSGDRLFALEIQDGAQNVIYHQDLDPKLKVGADKTQNFEMVPGATFVEGPEAREFLPDNLWLKNDWRLRIFDSAAIDPTGDDMIVRVRTLTHWL